MAISTEGSRSVVPVWDLADRLRKSLREWGLSVQDMADYLEVSRNSGSARINGRTRPNSQSLRLWAMRTGVPYDWGRAGHVTTFNGLPLPHLDSNQQPFGLHPAVVMPLLHLGPPRRITRSPYSVLALRMAAFRQCDRIRSAHLLSAPNKLPNH